MPLLSARAQADVSTASPWVAPPQLTPTPGNPYGSWGAAAWVGPSRTPGGEWTDANGVVAKSSIPWCPNEPNFKNGREGCTTMLTFCTNDGTAAVNDLDCDKPLRVMCAAPSANCGEGGGTGLRMRQGLGLGAGKPGAASQGCG
jgi:hypothetical protein